MTHSIEYYKARINILKNRGKDNWNIIKKMERKIRALEK